MQTIVNDIDELVRMLRNGSLTERAQAEEQFLHYGSDVIIRSIVETLIEDDEQERRLLITPLVESMQSSSILRREASVYGLLQIGHLCIPYLDKALLAYPSNKLIRKVKQEIKALDDALADVLIRNLEGVANDVSLPDLTDAMIRATKLSVTMDSERDNTAQVTAERLIAFIEINVDVWRNARREILQQGRIAANFLREALKDADVQTRRVAANLLSMLGDKQSAMDLANAIDDSDVFVRDESALALAKFDDAEVSRKLMEVYANSRTIGRDLY